MIKRNQTKLPSIKSILDYWELSLYRDKTEKLSFYFDREEPTCFACHDGHQGKYDCMGSKGWTSSRLERAHIIADSMGGTINPSNFVLLCKSCHKQNPHVRSRSVYMSWLNNFNKSQAKVCNEFLSNTLDESQLKEFVNLIESPKKWNTFIKWSSENTGSHAFVGAKTKLETTQDMAYNFLAYLEDGIKLK